ncbi:hypothetical protein HYU19_01510 [Candidatus Woesearchaeota archaeon]|nr:hypothetical protein [Candidatus Woesearchaeota archaeon]
MGTTTFYLKHNDLGPSLSSLSKDDIAALDKLSPFTGNNRYKGWAVPMELHNQNIYILVFWKGRLITLEDAPENLNDKYYDAYRGKTRREYEWTILRRYILQQVAYLDKKFKHQKHGTK